MTAVPLANKPRTSESEPEKDERGNGERISSNTID
jgi:hypothetical protein